VEGRGRKESRKGDISRKEGRRETRHAGRTEGRNVPADDGRFLVGKEAIVLDLSFVVFHVIIATQ
jgi:hypothetical protein